ncbi:LysR family transcriptional regulator [Bacillus pumilus]|uniref:LysR family transcriptional regulator n=1 Tax=Bacillus TaxID=1386 RepID=UPI000D03700B|nr:MULTISPECIES: LysR family transcriptional regulator [Bacillus]PRS70144.1 LysR family transcriptional regulator [Bacillus sp. NMTD17]PSB71173.1 LysR family transcriptional regulator [Bacillus sp. LNXM12-1]PSB75062.1 LysR family transcriptional regulator [Bacillus sp. LNXM12-2]UCZ72553.1 LysR family transcriptional regulator [Bacillus pumilus]
MELRHLITFKTIVNKNGFNKAAEHLGYAQSSITTHIKELEKELGRPLFDRLGKRIILTHFGEQYLPYANQIIELYEQSLTIDKEPQGDLTIGISESLTICRIPLILLEFKQKYPKVSLYVKSLENYDVTKSLQSGDIDLALVLENKNWTQEELYIEELVREIMVFISPHSKGETLNTALYSDLRCSYKSVFDDYIISNELYIKDSIEFQSIEAIKQCVKNGLGVSLVPFFSVKEELKNGLFKGEKVSNQQNSLSTYLTYHKDKWLSPSITSMIELVQKHAKTWE